MGWNFDVEAKFDLAILLLGRIEEVNPDGVGRDFFGRSNGTESDPRGLLAVCGRRFRGFVRVNRNHILTLVQLIRGKSCLPAANGSGLPAGRTSHPCLRAPTVLQARLECNSAQQGAL